MEVFNFVSDSQKRYFALGVFVGGGVVGNFYLSIGWNNLFLKALLVKIIEITNLQLTPTLG